jgi:hypothetical protein
MNIYMEPMKKLLEAAVAVTVQTEKMATVHYYGHVNTLDVYVSEGKEKPLYNNRLYDATVRMWMDDKEKVLQQFEQVTADLQEIANKKEVGTYAI